jgi:hypothetical protein
VSKSILRAVALCWLIAGCGGTEEGSAAKVALNELVPANVTGATDEAGEADDWIELYNYGSEAVSLEGYGITDDSEIPYKKRFGSELSIPAGGVLVLWADGDTEQGAVHLPFKLKAEGEKVQLYDPSGAIVDEYEWTNAIDDVAFARFPDGTGSWLACPAPTYDAVNGSACAR